MPRARSSSARATPGHGERGALDEPHARGAVDALEVEVGLAEPARAPAHPQLVERRVVELLERPPARLDARAAPLREVVVAREPRVVQDVPRDAAAGAAERRRLPREAGRHGQAAVRAGRASSPPRPARIAPRFSDRHAPAAAGAHFAQWPPPAVAAWKLAADREQPEHDEQRRGDDRQPAPQRPERPLRREADARDHRHRAEPERRHHQRRPRRRRPCRPRWRRRPTASRTAAAP